MKPRLCVECGRAATYLLREQPLCAVHRRGKGGGWWVVLPELRLKVVRAKGQRRVVPVVGGGLQKGKAA